MASLGAKFQKIPGEGMAGARHSLRKCPPKIRTSKKYLASISQNPLATVASAAHF